jgi:thiol-disulfide isomerase/thioredoxin
MFFRPFTALLLSVLCVGVLSAGEPSVGSPAPEFGGKQFFNLPATMSSPVTLSTLRGRVVVLDFWATWCGPCVASIPHLIELHNKYADQGLVIVGHTDGSSTNLEAFIKSKNIPYLISVGADIGDAYGVTGIPHVFVIDPDGKVAWHGHPSGLQEGTITPLLKNVRMSASPSPRFAKPAAVEKVARVEAGIAAGKVGAGIKALEKLADDKDAATAAAAKASLETITTWKAKLDGEIAKQREAGDVYNAAELAASVATSYTGHDEAKAYQAQVAELKKDAGYAAGKEFQKLDAIPAEARKDPRFTKMVEAFLKKFETGYYADRARALTK